MDSYLTFAIKHSIIDKLIIYFISVPIGYGFNLL